MKTVLITGSSGLIGSACVRHFDAMGCSVIGIDSDARKEFFGKDGDTSWVTTQLRQDYQTFWPYKADIRNREAIASILMDYDFDLIIHCAAQPSHDWATGNPITDFQINAVGTLNLLEATRQHAPDATFIFCSTNKVYGDAPNELPLIEKPTRWEYGFVKTTYCDRYGDTVDGEDTGVDPELGINENMRIDASRHSLFGASKLAADILVQEYGRTFGMKTACFRMGCITGGAHAGAEQHGFLAYLVRCAREGRKYTIYGYKGKQVRDNLHADDVASAFALFAANPKVAAVYNLGGGRENSISVREAIERLGNVEWKYVDTPRGGDHICYYSDTTKFRTDYPEWRVTKTLDDIFSELVLTPAADPLSLKH